MTTFPMSNTHRARAARRAHDLAYFLMACALLTIAAAYGAFTGDYFGWDRLAKAGAHSWLFLGFVFAPSWVCALAVIPAACHWHAGRKWVG